MLFDVFLSYARSDGEDASASVEQELTKRGFSVWRDRRNIDPYQDFSSEIEIGIRKSAFVVVCVTPSIINQDRESFVRREIIYAQQLHKPIIPAVWPHAIVPTLINHLTWISFGQGPKGRQELDFDAGMVRLLNRLDSGAAPSDQPIIYEDPLRPYLSELYEQIIEVLSATVLSFVPLSSISSKDAVTGDMLSRRALPVTFLARSAGVTATDDLEPESSFRNLQCAFSKSDERLLLLGDPGAGKTTILLAFAREAVARRLEDPTQPVPIVAPIATWNPVDALTLDNWLGEIITAVEQDVIDELLSNGQALLLLDGLDELGRTSTNKNGEVFDPRARFAEGLPAGNSILITCRAREYTEIGKKLPLGGAVVLQPLDDAGIAEFLQETPDLLAAVKSDDQLLAMARTPLLLSLFAFAYRDLGDEATKLRDLASGPAELRDKIIGAYVSRRVEHESIRWRESGDATLTAEIDDVYEVLGKLAKNLALDWRNDFTPSWLEDIVGEKLVERWLELGMRLHLIVNIGENSWRFIHLLVQNHFAFEPILEDLQDSNMYVVADSALALGSLRDSRAIEPLIELLGDEGHNGNARAAAVSALTNFNDPKVLELLRGFLDVSDSSLRARVVLALGTLGDKTVRDDLIAYACLEFQPTRYGHMRTEHYDDQRSIASQAADLLQDADDPNAKLAIEAYENREFWANNEEWREWEQHADDEHLYE